MNHKDSNLLGCKNQFIASLFILAKERGNFTLSCICYGFMSFIGENVISQIVSEHEMFMCAYIQLYDHTKTILTYIEFTGTMVEFQQGLCLGHGWAMNVLMMCQTTGGEETHSITSLKPQWAGALHLCHFQISLGGPVCPIAQTVQRDEIKCLGQRRMTLNKAMCRTVVC
jgi:hypothetical protein